MCTFLKTPKYQPSLHSQFEASLSYVVKLFQNKKRNKTTGQAPIGRKRVLTSKVAGTLQKENRSEKESKAKSTRCMRHS